MPDTPHVQSLSSKLEWTNQNTFIVFCRNQSETILLQSSPELLISLLNMPIEIDVTVRKLRAIDAQPVKLKISSSKFVPLQIVLVILLDDVFIRQYVR